MTARTHNRPFLGGVTILAALGATSLTLMAASPADAIYRSYELSDSEAPVLERTAERDDAPTGETKQGCNLKLPNGALDVYKHGDVVTITVKGSDGTSYTVKFRCNDGTWEPASAVPQADEYHYEADYAYVDSSALVLVDPHEEYTYSGEGGFYAEP